MAAVKFLYLDVGGVALLDLTFNNRWELMLQNLGVTEANRAAFDTVWKRHYHEICTTYDADLMIPEFRTEVGLNLPADFSFTGLFVELFEVNPSLSKILTVAREQNIKIGLLTNMYFGMLESIFAAQKLTKADYDVIIDSSIEKLQKPDLAIYEVAENKTNVRAEEILFVDNLSKNLEPATARGWQTLLYHPENFESATQSVIDYLKNGR